MYGQLVQLEGLSLLDSSVSEKMVMRLRDIFI